MSAERDLLLQIRDEAKEWANEAARIEDGTGLGVASLLYSRICVMIEAEPAPKDEADGDIEFRIVSREEQDRIERMVLGEGR